MTKDHIIREVVDNLKIVAYKFHNTQQLRSRIQEALDPLLEHITELELVAAEFEELKAKAAKWDEQEYWTTGGRGGHGAG